MLICKETKQNDLNTEDLIKTQIFGWKKTKRKRERKNNVSFSLIYIAKQKTVIKNECNLMV